MYTTGIFDSKLESIIQDKINNLDHNYKISCLKNANDFKVIKKIINQGIDSRLNAIEFNLKTVQDIYIINRIEIEFLNNGLFIFLYRLFDLWNITQQDIYYELYSSILCTLNIELI